MSTNETASGETGVPSSVARNGTEAIVEVEGVYKSFGPQRVLNGVNLTVNRGETMAVLGRSGTGKSVLLRLIVGLQEPDSGSVRVFGQAIAGMTLDQLAPLRTRMGFMFQHAALYDSLSVARNVAFPLEHHRSDMARSERDDRVQQLLAEVSMEKHGSKMPADLSGGMQKRVALARALILEPELLLLDEQRDLIRSGLPRSMNLYCRCKKGTTWPSLLLLTICIARERLPTGSPCSIRGM
jgi:ABC-type transporter Mla maintaining outer membrane lipid asymmetry ATPase subunit MlaF